MQLQARSRYSIQRPKALSLLPISTKLLTLVQAKIPSVEGVAIMEYVIGALWVGLELLCAIYFNGSFLPEKKVQKHHIVAIIIIWMFTCVYTNTSINQLVKQLLLVIIYAGISMMLYRGNCIVHVCLAIIGYIFIAAIDAIAINGMCYRLGISYITFVWRKFSYITLTTADKLLAFF